MQAMSVMKRGMPPAGVNPVPVKVAVPPAAFAAAAPEQSKQPDVATSVTREAPKQGTPETGLACPVMHL